MFGIGQKTGVEQNGLARHRQSRVFSQQREQHCPIAKLGKKCVQVLEEEVCHSWSRRAAGGASSVQGRVPSFRVRVSVCVSKLETRSQKWHHGSIKFLRSLLIRQVPGALDHLDLRVSKALRQRLGRAWPHGRITRAPDQECRNLPDGCKRFAER